MDPVVWAIILLLIGLALIALEMFVPSGGLLGVLAGFAILASIIMGFTGGPRVGVLVLLAVVLVVPAMIGAAVKFWPDTPVGRLILIQRPGDASEVLPDSEYFRGLKQLVGQTGRVKSPMRPSGLVEVGGRAYDATSAGMSLDVGQPVEIIAVRTNRIIVQPCDEPAPGKSPPVPSDDPLTQPIEQFGIEPLDDPLA